MSFSDITQLSLIIASLKPSREKSYGYSYGKEVIMFSADVNEFVLLSFRDITNMKGTIVAQVDSSESFQEFCSTGCLGAYENKQNPPKSAIKTKCTVCGKLTEVGVS